MLVARLALAPALTQRVSLILPPLDSPHLTLHSVPPPQPGPALQQRRLSASPGPLREGDRLHRTAREGAVRRPSGHQTQPFDASGAGHVDREVRACGRALATCLCWPSPERGQRAQSRAVAAHARRAPKRLECLHASASQAAWSGLCRRCSGGGSPQRQRPTATRVDVDGAQAWGSLSRRGRGSVIWRFAVCTLSSPRALLLPQGSSTPRPWASVIPTGVTPGAMSYEYHLVRAILRNNHSIAVGPAYLGPLPC
ncbi:hypothetical protein BDV95DRAFT_320231 [Massariosphaeria phaeospora]|uniref:Uncharacterized protein n=1 Tax=Massariosphaeria phaeospora TaxID=100035 RepID=A0A7C8IBN8_9PLEO|nr:hypothetical protein BDV95DRAFT_320231 [Massariosphaeria phaeospora]